MIWAVVPAKDLSRAKTRLSGLLTPSHRGALYRAMLADVLETLLQVDALAGIVLVARDPELLALGRALGLRIIAEDASRGQSAAVARAAAALEAEGSAGIITVPGDVPLVAAAEIAALLRCREAAPSLTIVPSRDGSGSNCLVVSPPNAIPFRFGPDSFRRHLDAARRAGIRPRRLELPGLALDIDDPHDLEALLLRSPGGHTAAVLQEMGLGVGGVAIASSRLAG